MKYIVSDEELLNLTYKAFNAGSDGYSDLKESVCNGLISTFLRDKLQNQDSVKFNGDQFMRLDEFSLRTSYDW